MYWTIEPDWPVRIVLYIILGIVNEVLFTGICDVLNPMYLKSWNIFSSEKTPIPPVWRHPRRDPRAVGYTFLWMIPIYPLLIFLEPLSVTLSGLPWFLRGLIYTICFYFVEASTGLLLTLLIGRCPWDYSSARFHWRGVIRFDFFPLWFLFMLFVEWLGPKFIALSPVLVEIFSH